MMGDLFIVHDMPEPPKEGFFKGLFGGGARTVDREELCKYRRLKKFLNLGWKSYEFFSKQNVSYIEN